MQIKGFASTNRGLENLLATEITKIGASDVAVVKSGVTFTTDVKMIMAINLYSRLASRVMIEITCGNYLNEDDIYDLAGQVKWHEWFGVKNSIKVKTSAIKSSLRSLEFINLKVKDAICDYFVKTAGSRPDVNKKEPDILVYCFLTNDKVTIYLDTSGESLFKRGYRANKLEAPLKENLAAGLVNISNWQPYQTFYDPMCGSGTIAIEAMMIGLNIAPGLKRSFAFEKFVSFDNGKWQALCKEAHEVIKRRNKLSIYASDINPQAISLAKDNLYKLGKEYQINLYCKDFVASTAPDDNGIMVSNLPYGVRLSDQDTLRELYPALAQTLKKQYHGWHCYLLSADLELPTLMRLKPSKKVPLYNGALDCRLFEFKMVQGSNRRE